MIPYHHAAGISLCGHIPKGDLKYTNGHSFACFYRHQNVHDTDVIMISAMASQITRLTIVYSTVYSGADQRKHQRSTSLAFVRGIHRWPVNSSHKRPVTRKLLPFDDVIMFVVGVYYSRKRRQLCFLTVVRFYPFVFVCLSATLRNRYARIFMTNSGYHRHGTGNHWWHCHGVLDYHIDTWFLFLFLSGHVKNVVLLARPLKPPNWRVCENCSLGPRGASCYHFNMVILKA